MWLLRTSHDFEHARYCSLICSAPYFRYIKWYVTLIVSSERVHAWLPTCTILLKSGYCTLFHDYSVLRCFNCAECAGLNMRALLRQLIHSFRQRCIQKNWQVDGILAVLLFQCTPITIFHSSVFFSSVFITSNLFLLGDITTWKLCCGKDIQDDTQYLHPLSVRRRERSESVSRTQSPLLWAVWGCLLVYRLCIPSVC